jgi:hypothetical protein
MIVLQFRSYIVRALVLGAALVTLGSHLRYAREPATMDDLLRVSYVVPYAAGHTLGPVIQKAVMHEMNYLHQAVLYFVAKGGGAHSVTWYRAIDGVLAVLAVLWIYRVGSLCCSSLTGLASAFALALTPPALWGRFAMHIFLILLHCEVFLMSVRRDTLVQWVAWSGVTLLLFMNGVFAEPLLLQSWFLALVLVWFIWLYGARFLPEREGFIRGSYTRGHRRGNTIWEKLRQDTGVSRFATTILGIAIVILVLSFVGGTFFSKLVASFDSIVKLLMLVIGLTVLAAVALLMTPLFARERNMVLDRLVNLRLTREINTPQLLFQRVERVSLLHGLFAYSCAVLAFLPLSYAYRAHLNIYIDNWEAARFVSFMQAHCGWLAWVSLALPLVALGGTVTGYLGGLFSRARVIGTAALFVLASIFLLQQRYAVYAAPFQLILTVGAVTTLIDLGVAMLPIAWGPTPEELEELT